MYHIIKEIEAGELDLRDKVRIVAGTMLPTAIAFCGERIALQDRQRIKRLGGQAANAICCDECLANLVLIGE